VVNSLQSAGSEHQLEFENLLLIVHYYAMRAAMRTLNGLDGHIAKLSTALLRHTNIVPGMSFKPNFTDFFKRRGSYHFKELEFINLQAFEIFKHILVQ